MKARIWRTGVVVKNWNFGVKGREPNRIGKNKKYTKIYHNPVAIIYIINIILQGIIFAINPKHMYDILVHIYI